jgi:hypothetical protein
MFQILFNPCLAIMHVHHILKIYDLTRPVLTAENAYSISRISEGQLYLVEFLLWKGAVF